MASKKVYRVYSQTRKLFIWEHPSGIRALKTSPFFLLKENPLCKADMLFKITVERIGKKKGRGK